LPRERPFASLPVKRDLSAILTGKTAEPYSDLELALYLTRPLARPASGPAPRRSRRCGQPRSRKREVAASIDGRCGVPQAVRPSPYS